MSWTGSEKSCGSAAAGWEAMLLCCFVILHYIAAEETEKCVESLLRLAGDKKIIIVDNASPNGSGKKLQEMYRDEAAVEVLLSHENLGFARGNNLGYRYSAEFHPDYVVVMNNDMEILQPDFIQRIGEIDRREAFHVLGPDVYSVKTGAHQSPETLRPMTFERLQRRIAFLRKNQRYPIRLYVRSAARRILMQSPPGRRLWQKYDQRRTQARVGGEIDYGKVYRSVPLHGSCVIFSKRYMERRPYAFFPETFMYMESAILNYECLRDGMKQVYDPSIRVLHYEDAATDRAYKNGYKKSLFKNARMLESAEAFARLMERDGAASKPS